MKTFKDATGREWTLSVTVGSVKRVRDLMGLNLLEPGEGETPLLTRLGTDAILLADVLYCLCKPQCEERGVTDEQFGQALDGAAFLRASDSFWLEYHDFFLQSGKPHLAAAIERQKALIAQAVMKAQTAISGI